MKKLNHYFVLILITLLLSSCNGSRYNVLHSVGNAEKTISKMQGGAPTIQVGQELCITVTSINEESAQYFRTSREREGATGIECLYYKVKENGSVQLALIGDVKIEGMSLVEAELKVAEALDRVIKEPGVTIQYVDYHVSVMGEVSVPGLFNVPSGSVTIFEALAKAQGLSQYARRNNVLIIREINDEIKHIRIDLTEEDIWNSDYYYLHHKDIIVVSSNSGRIINSHNATAWGSVLVGIGTVSAIILTR
jgi:polysaccharide export outer membrane protein